MAGEQVKVFGSSPTELFDASEVYAREGVVIVTLDDINPEVATTYKGKDTLFPPRVWHLNDHGEYVGVRHDIVSDGSAFGEYLERVQSIGANLGAKVFPKSVDAGREIQDQVYEVAGHGRSICAGGTQKLGDLATAPIAGAWVFKADERREALLTPGSIAFVNAAEIKFTEEVAGTPSVGPAVSLIVADQQRTPYF